MLSESRSREDVGGEFSREVELLFRCQCEERDRHILQCDESDMKMYRLGARKWGRMSHPVRYAGGQGSGVTLSARWLTDPWEYRTGARSRVNDQSQPARQAGSRRVPGYPGAHARR